jgi:enoyl-CoA hydratase/carnithine racemase
MIDGIRTEREGPVGRIVFSRPDRLNALTLEVQEQVVAAATQFAGDPELRVVVLRGDGGTFTAGADLGMLQELHGAGDVDRAHADLGRRMIDAVESIPAVTIAQIEGHCVGGGVVLAAACNLRVAAADTYFSIPEVDLGIPLGWGAVPRLVREIGPARTLELVGTCRPFSAEEAHAMGFVNRVVPRNEVAETVDGLAETLAAKPDYALKTVTSTVRAAAEAVVTATGMTGDADLLLGAAGDEEGAQAAQAYIARLMRMGE